MKILVLPVVLGLAAGLSAAEPVTGPIIDDTEDEG
mgnify:CR=1 FL=1